MANGQQTSKPQTPRPDAFTGHWPLGILLAIGPWAFLEANLTERSAKRDKVAANEPPPARNSLVLVILG